jgi:hypothetical protein
MKHLLPDDQSIGVLVQTEIMVMVPEAVWIVTDLILIIRGDFPGGVPAASDTSGPPP